MSEINDALKRARQMPPPDKPSRTILTNPLPPRAKKPMTGFRWMIPPFIVVLFVTAIFLIGWAAAHRPVRKKFIAPSPAVPIRPAVEITSPIQPKTTPASAPVVTSMPVSAPVVPPVLPKLPKLQGIFYSTTAPTAILDGKTIGVGDKFGDYRVQHISQNTVTLLAADGRVVTIGMSH